MMILKELKRLWLGGVSLVVLMSFLIILNPGLQAQTSLEGDATSLEGFGEESELEGFGEDEAIGSGFEQLKVELDEEAFEPVEEKKIRFGGYFKEELDYSYAKDNPDISKLKTTLNLDLSFRISDDWSGKLNWNGFYDYAYTYQGRDQFSEETLTAYELESEFRDLYVEGGIVDGVRAKIGRQIIAWGQSESVRITDVANPQDLRELGMVDLEDARVPVGATKLSLLVGTLELNAVAIHEIRGHKQPGAYSEFDLLQEMRSQTQFTINEEEVPESSVDNSEYLIRLFKTFNGGDIGFIWADVYDDAVYLDFETLVVKGVPNSFSITLTPKHKRIGVMGVAGNLVSGSWLLKTDLARKTGVALQKSETALKQQLMATLPTLTLNTKYDSNTQLMKTWAEKDVVQGMLGLEYSGLSDLKISLEAVGEQIQDYDESLSSREFKSQFALICRYSGLNDALDAQFFWIHFSDNNGDVFRVNVAYDLRDALNISAGFIAYQASDADAMLYGYRQNDRIFTAVKYSF